MNAPAFGAFIFCMFKTKLQIEIISAADIIVDIAAGEAMKKMPKSRRDLK